MNRRITQKTLAIIAAVGLTPFQAAVLPAATAAVLELGSTVQATAQPANAAEKAPAKKTAKTRNSSPADRFLAPYVPTKGMWNPPIGSGSNKVRGVRHHARRLAKKRK